MTQRPPTPPTPFPSNVAPLPRAPGAGNASREFSLYNLPASETATSLNARRALMSRKSLSVEEAGARARERRRDASRIQRFDREDPALLAPGQGYFLRENLKLRLLNARLALFSRDQWTYRNELKVAQEWLGKHFDTNDKAVVGAQSTLRQMTASEINVELPNLNETQAALRNLRQTKEKR